MPLLALLVTFGAAIFQVAQAPPTKYDGVWIGQFEGTTYVRLELRTVNGAVTGALSIGDIELNKDGTLKHATPGPKALSPVFDVRTRGAVVTFVRKEGDDTEQFELEIKGTEADLRLLLTDEMREELKSDGIATPKPFRLKRG